MNFILTKTLTIIITILVALVGCVNSDEYWQGNTKFGFDLMNDLSKDGNLNNVFISPFSISSAFSLAYAGAPNRTATHNQIANVLHYPQSVSEVDLAKQIIRQQDDLADSSSQNVDVSIANRIFYNHKSKLNDQITDVIGSNNYQPLDFSNKQAALDVINKWIEDNTDGEIKDMVKKVSRKTFAAIINVC